MSDPLDVWFDFSVAGANRGMLMTATVPTRTGSLQTKTRLRPKGPTLPQAPPMDPRTYERRRELLRVLTGTWMPFTTIRARFRGLAHRSTIQRVLDRLVTDGQVERRKDGYQVESVYRKREIHG